LECRPGLAGCGQHGQFWAAQRFVPSIGNIEKL
jgi:hypothetical protein